MNISVVGLGKLGLCTAACIASKGHRVIGFDIDDAKVSKLKHGEIPISETGIADLLRTSHRTLSFTSDIDQIVSESEATFIIVPTPSEPDGNFSNAFVMDVLKNLSTDLGEKNTFHVINIVSTVMPGSSEKVFKPYLEESTGKVCGKDFGLVYNPEFIALGSVIRDFMNPDMILIGADDAYSSALIRRVYESTCDNSPRYAQMSLINAEITKLSINCYITMKISYANELAGICERIPGADVDEITSAAGMDSRIGSRCMKSGLGFGGPCFPRDNAAFEAFAGKVGVEAQLCKKVRKINTEVVKRITDAIRRRIPIGSEIAVLGLAYKAGTHIIEESQSITLVNCLLNDGYGVSVHDPMAIEEVKAIFGNRITYHKTPDGTVINKRAAVFMTDWPEYRLIEWKQVFSRMAKGAFVFDSWLMLKERDLGDISYWGPGFGEK